MVKETSRAGHKPKIAFFLPDLRVGGAEHMMAVLASSFAKRGLDVDFVLVRAQGKYLEILDSTIKVFDLDSKSTYWCLPRLVRYIRAQKPTVLLSALDLTNIFGIIASVISNQRHSIFIRLDNTQSMINRTKIKKFIEKLLIRVFYPRAEKIIAVSRAVAEDFKFYQPHLSEKVITIYNPILRKDIQLKAAQSIHHVWFENHQKPVILGVGRLNEQKNFEMLIKAFAKIAPVIPSRLLILGEGPQRNQLEKLINELGIGFEVDLPGIVDNPYPFFANADLFVLSSNYEGLPTVLVEALACNCPVVSTDCPSGPREILDNGKYGKLVPVGDEDALAQAMISSLEGEIQTIDSDWLQQFDQEYVASEYLSALNLISSENDILA
jgi:glycosyltransferase involved in cell wall biosynthesis